MTFPQAIGSGFRRYADFVGPAGRSEFWWWILFTTLVAAALAALPVPTIAVVEGGTFTAPTLTPVWQIAVLLPTLAVTVRRLRDAASSWGHLFWILLPFAGVIVLAVLCSQPSAARVDGRQPMTSAEVLG